MGDSSDNALSIWLEQAPLADLIAASGSLRDEGHGRSISYSRKVFIPLTKLCRDVCHYCTFAERPRAGRPAYLSPKEVLAIARAGAAAGCTEALFTLGDKPELRYRAAREALAALGHATTIDYLRAMCALVLHETGLLPHVNPGVMTASEIAGLRRVSASLGIMLESISARLCEPGGVHYGSPDKLPEVRLETMRLAGELAVPFTTGILIGIGETRAERLERRWWRSAALHRALRPHPGSHRAEFPRQAEHQAGGRAGTRSGRSAVEHRRGAADPAGRTCMSRRRPTCRRASIRS